VADELKPCPNCGEAVKIERIGTLDGPEVVRISCCVRMSQSVGYNRETMENFWDEAATLLAGYWNARPVEDALRARVAELESAERFVPFVRAIRDAVKAKDLKMLTKATDGLLEAFALYEQRAEPRAPRGAEGES
jgi:hypothetical protein